MPRFLFCTLVGFFFVFPWKATAEPLHPGDILVAAEDAGVIRHYSADGREYVAFANNLSMPAWITTDPAGNVYVPEFGANAIRKLSPSGTLLLTIPTSFTPGGVAIGTDGSIYVAHYDAGKIHRYSSSGADLGIFASYSTCADGCGTDFVKFDAAGNLYVGDFQPFGRVRLISPAGVDLGDFVTTSVRGGVEGLGFDASGNLYISNYNNTGACIVEKFSPSGDDLGPFATPVCYGFDFDSDGNLYSAASGGPIVKFSSSGENLGGFGVGGRDLVIVPGPVAAEQCEKDGWRIFQFPRIFKNQGDCVSWVHTGR